ncbi:unnamed protein product, partial [marine sediment metagenome]
MGTGLKASYLREEKTREFYALEAGIEDAASRIRGDYGPEGFELPQDPGDQVSYILEDEVNGRQVEVTIETVWLLEDLESDANGNMPHEELVVVGSYSSVEESQGSYKIEVSYDGSVGELMLDKVGAWLPAGYNYVSGSASGIITDDPNIIPHRGGIALEWEFFPPVAFHRLPNPEVPQGEGFQPGTEYPMKRELTFEFTPGMNPRGAFTWMRTMRSDIYLSWDIMAKTYKVTSTAEDGATGERITAE